MKKKIDSSTKQVEKKHGYAPINGLNMYYEIEGKGEPLVYIPPIFGFAGVNEFPLLTASWQLITVDLQGHGHTADIDRPISFEQHADDVAALLDYLNIKKANFLGESFGGVVAMNIAVRRPELIKRLATYAAIFGPFQDSYKPEMLATAGGASADSYGIQFQRENYMKVAPDPAYWATIWAKVMSTQWNGFSKEQLNEIKIPVLVAVGDNDFVRLDHAIDTFQKIPNSQLAVIPDAGHFVLNAEPQKVLPQIKYFFDEPDNRLPFATTATGYHPGINR